MGEASKQQPFRSWRAWLAAIILGLVAVPLIWGGAELLLAGGSAYYGLAGIGLAVLAWLAAHRNARVPGYYAFFLAATLAWSLWEVGLDGWKLLPRLAAPTVLGLFVWLLSGRSAKFAVRQVSLAGLAALAVGLGSHALRAQRSDPIYALGQGGPSGGVSAVADADTQTGDWRHYGGDRGSTRYSALDRITPVNAAKLELAWTYKSGILENGNSGLEVTPLKVGNRLFLCTGYNDIIALDAESGEQVWRHRAKSDLRNVGLATCRGVAWYRKAGAAGVCADRIIAGTVDARLLALDAASGQPCQDFGRNGEISLLEGMGTVPKGYYYVTSAPAVVRGKVVVGGWVSDGVAWGEPSGVVRAFDAVSGELAWAWDLGRPDRRGVPPQGEAYTRSTPNSWAPMSADEELGLIYIPTGNSTPDYFGGLRRPFDDRYSSSVVALDAETGEARWNFQTTHHDLWDYDVASPPSLVDIKVDGTLRKALVQPTKRGEIFVLDRMTGKPIKAVTEMAVPTGGAAANERVSSTQPFSTGMPSFRGPDLVEADMWGVTPLDQLWCRLHFKRARYEGTMTPPGLVPNIAYPGFMGGMNWGGVSIDPVRGLLIANTMRVPVTVQLVPRKEAERQGVHPVEGPPGKHNTGWQVQANTPYAAKVSPFLSPLGVPCNAPPYGILSAVDLASGKLVWSNRLGSARDSGPFGLRSMLPVTMGVPNIGGSVITKGGVVFIAASTERSLKAFDLRTGRELWSTNLPTGGHATPMTYLSAGGRQFVVIAAGGNRVLGTPPGDTLMAFALPR